MQVVEIDDTLAAEISKAAMAEKRNFNEYVNTELWAAIEKQRRKADDVEKVRRFQQAYEKSPQTEDEIAVWEELQDWGDE